MSELPDTLSHQETNTAQERLRAHEFKTLVAEYGFTGQNPSERINNLKEMPASTVALFITDVNRRLQGSDESLIDDRIVKIGEKETIAPPKRAELFIGLIDKIHKADGVSPERIGDTLALGILLLHPFQDGNGRTSRMMGLLFRDEFDQPDYVADYDALSESRDAVRATEGRNVLVSYVPYLPEGADQSRAEDVDAYFETLLHDGDDPRLYMGLGGVQAPLSDVEK